MDDSADLFDSADMFALAGALTTEVSRRMITFLEQRGVEFRPAFREFDYAEFDSTYRMLHPDDDTDGPLSDALKSALDQAVEKFYRHQSFVHQNFERIKWLVSVKSLMVHLEKHFAATPPVPSGMSRQNDRLWVIRHLWLENCWVDPWKELVEVEFPGTGPTEADIEGFIATSADNVSESLAAQEEGAGVVQDMYDVLEAADYYTTARDDHLLLSLMLLVHQFRNKPPSWILEAEIRTGARQMISEYASQPNHPVWEAILAKYLPDD